LFEDSENEEESGMEKVLKVQKIAKDGMAGCHVAYFPQRYNKKLGAHKFNHVFICVDTNLHK
jgi:hypothetical protein